MVTFFISYICSTLSIHIQWHPGLLFLIALVTQLEQRLLIWTHNSCTGAIITLSPNNELPYILSLAQPAVPSLVQRQTIKTQLG